MDPTDRPARKVAVADHIWELFEEMASQMGSDRDALINQAMFMFARLNGFTDGAPAAKGLRSPSTSAARPSAQAPAPLPPAPAPAAGLPRTASRAVEPAAGRMDDDPVRREVAERVLETAAELERMIKNKNQPASDSSGEDSASSGSARGEESGSDAGPKLYLMAEGGELDRIAKERFVIGRGKHCDFVINSGKVSREHAAIVREGGEFFVEDLGSSNGTWFNKQRIKRRKIEDNDEYFICSEKVKFVYR